MHPSDRAVGGGGGGEGGAPRKRGGGGGGGGGGGENRGHSCKGRWERKRWEDKVGSQRKSQNCHKFNYM